MAKQNATPDLSLLDKSIDDIEDLPGFAVPANGVYSLKFKTAVKVVNEKTCIESSFEVMEALELNDPDEVEGDVDMAKASSPGTKFSLLSQVENDVAMGKFKAMIAPVAEHFGERSVLKLVTDTLKDEVIITATVKRRFDKKDDTKVYADVSGIMIA